MKIFSFVVAFLGAFFLFSCKKEIIHNGDVGNVNHGGFEDNRQMEIILESPSELDTLFHENSLTISGKIKGNFTLHGYSLRIYNTETNQMVWVRNKHTHGEEIVFHETWNHNLAESTPLLLEILAVGNHEGTMDMFKRLNLFFQKD